MADIENYDIEISKEIRDKPFQILPILEESIKLLY